MTVRESLQQVIATLPESKVAQVLDFAEFLALKSELGPFQQAGKEHLASCYGDNEPEYTLGDVKLRGKP